MTATTERAHAPEDVVVLDPQSPASLCRTGSRRDDFTMISCPRRYRAITVLDD